MPIVIRSSSQQTNGKIQTTCNSVMEYYLFTELTSMWNLKIPLLPGMQRTMKGLVKKQVLQVQSLLEKLPVKVRAKAHIKLKVKEAKIKVKVRVKAQIQLVITSITWVLSLHQDFCMVFISEHLMKTISMNASKLNQKLWESFKTQIPSLRNPLQTQEELQTMASMGSLT